MATHFSVPLKALEIVSPSELTLETARAWHAYWLDLQQNSGGDVPARSELDLIRRRPDLAGLAVWIEVLADDYRFRLAGEEVRRLFGRSIKGLHFSEIDFGSFRETTRRQYDTAVAQRRPCCSVGTYTFRPESAYRLGGTTLREVVMMPFCNAMGAIDRLLAGMAFDAGTLEPAGPGRPGP